MENYYHILGVPKSASSKDIKKAFKKLAVKYHPDKNQGNRKAEEKFKQINTAYQVLSDPSSKAQYDLRLMNRDYERQFHGDRKPNPQHRDPKYRGAGHGNRDIFTRQHKARYSKKDDQRKGVFWAIGIITSILGVFLIVLGVNIFLDYLHKQEVEARRQELNKQVKEDMDADDFDSLLVEINDDLDAINGFDLELDRFKHDVIDMVKAKAQESFNNKEYDKAKEFFLLWEDIDPSDEVFLNTRLAEVHKNLGEYEDAQLKLERMIEQERSIVFCYAELARIHHNHLNDLDQALEFYNIACDHILDDYKKEFGDAYGIMLVPKRLPDLQYEVYLEKGQVNLALGNYEDAIVACNWAMFIRSGLPEAYAVKGEAEYELGNVSVACQDFKEAQARGYSFESRLSAICDN